MGEVIRLSPVEIAPVRAEIVRVKPYTTLDPATGVVDTVIAGYIDKEDDSGQVIPFGKVSSVPVMDEIISAADQVLARAASSRIDGLVGDQEVFSQISAIGYSHVGQPVLYKGDEIAENTKQLQREATQAILSHLGIHKSERGFAGMTARALGRLSWPKIQN